MAEIKNKNYQIVLAYQNKKYLIETEEGRAKLLKDYPDKYEQVMERFPVEPELEEEVIEEIEEEVMEPEELED